MVIIFFLPFPVYIGQLILGYTLGWTAPVIALLQSPEQTILETPITVEQASWIVSTSFAGVLTGMFKIVIVNQNGKMVID